MGYQRRPPPRLRLLSAAGLCLCGAFLIFCWLVYSAHLWP